MASTVSEEFMRALLNKTIHIIMFDGKKLCGVLKTFDEVALTIETREYAIGTRPAPALVRWASVNIIHP